MAVTGLHGHARKSHCVVFDSRLPAVAFGKPLAASNTVGAGGRINDRQRESPVLHSVAPG